MVNKKVVCICSIIALIIVIAIVAFYIKKFKESEYVQEEVETNNQNLATEQNIIKNEVEEENVVEENQIMTENITEENVSDTQIQGEEETNTEENNENSDNKALSLVKDEWGEDDTVYYTIDNKSNTIYNISVRSKSTTATLAEYEVDVSNDTVKIK